MLQALRDSNLVAVLCQRIDVHNVGWFVHDRLIKASTSTLADDHSVILIVPIDKVMIFFSYDSFHLLAHLVVFPRIEVVLLVSGVAVAEGGEIGEL